MPSWIVSASYSDVQFFNKTQKQPPTCRRKCRPPYRPTSIIIGTPCFALFICNPSENVTIEHGELRNGRAHHCHEWRQCIYNQLQYSADTSILQLERLICHFVLWPPTLAVGHTLPVGATCTNSFKGPNHRLNDRN